MQHGAGRVVMPTPHELPPYRRELPTPVEQGSRLFRTTVDQMRIAFALSIVSTFVSIAALAAALMR